MRVSLRLKLALLSLLLLAIPYTGLRLAAIVQANLVQSREEALLFSARAVAQALSGREGLFDRERFHLLDRQRDLYLFPLSSPMRLNGKADDWQPHLESALVFGREHLLGAADRFTPGDAGYSYLAGTRGGFLYALFQVDDDRIVYRKKNSLALDRSDHLQIALKDNGGTLNRYIVAPTEPGWVNGYHASSDSDSILPARAEPRIQGVLAATAAGYTLEIRLPLSMVGERFAFAIADVDDPVARDRESVIGTANLEHPEKLGWLLSPSDDIEAILAALNRPQSQIRVIDRNRHVRASYGSLAPGMDGDTPPPATKTILTRLNTLLMPFYRLFTEPVATGFEMFSTQPGPLAMQGIEEALAGNSSVISYRTDGGELEIMAATTPLYENEQVVGAVMVEQSTNSILALKNRVIEESLGLTLLLMLSGGFGLLLFAFRVSSRIRKLRDQAAGAISEHGMIEEIPRPSAARDEIGDLSRTLASMLGQLKEQVHYREKMADNLEHEMRTPLAGASSSLQNLAKELGGQPEHLHAYVRWALGDIRRMEDLLTAIRDATSLQQALDLGEKVRFNLAEAITVWLAHSWQPSYAGVDFSFAGVDGDIMILGDPDRIRQMLDKLIDNAVSFRTPGTPVEIELRRTGKTILIDIVNQGPIIAEEMRESIFNSMTSQRDGGDSGPHLGLGLYIVRTIAWYHGGKVAARNLAGERQGVCLQVSLPVLPPDSRARA